MKKWNPEIFNDIKISQKTYNKAFDLINIFSRLNLTISWLFKEYNFKQKENLWFKLSNFIETKFSSQIEGVNSTLFENVNAHVEKSSSLKKLDVITNALSNVELLSYKHIQDVAKKINDGKNEAKRWEPNFGIYQDRFSKKIYQPPLKKNMVDKYLNQLFGKITKKDNNIIDYIITHIKFEMIHPFFDGNGRIGRIILQKQLSKTYFNNKVIPFSWAIYQQKTNYYHIFDLVYQDFDKAIFNFLEILRLCVKTTCKFILDLISFYSKYKKNLFVASRLTKKDKLLARYILLSIQTSRKEIEEKFGLNPKTIDLIYQKINDSTPFNPQKIKNKITYWNVGLEEIANKHYKVEI